MKIEIDVDGITDELLKAETVWLRNVGSDEDRCWVPCAMGDPGAELFAMCGNAMAEAAMQVTVTSAILGRDGRNG